MSFLVERQVGADVRMHRVCETYYIGANCKTGGTHGEVRILWTDD